MNANNNGFNHRIACQFTRTLILNIEDALALDTPKIKVAIVKFQKGQGQQERLTHWLDLDTARLIFTEMATGHLTLTNGYKEYKGSMKGDQLVSRIFEVAEIDHKSPVKVSLASGPGKEMPTGAIQPDGKPPHSLSFLLSRRDAARIGLATLHHITAWESATFLERISAEQAGKQGDSLPPATSAPNQADDHIATYLADESEVAEAEPEEPTLVPLGDVEPTPTGFWSIAHDQNAIPAEKVREAALRHDWTWAQKIGWLQAQMAMSS